MNWLFALLFALSPAPTPEPMVAAMQPEKHYRRTEERRQEAIQARQETPNPVAVFAAEPSGEEIAELMDAYGDFEFLFVDYSNGTYNAYALNQNDNTWNYFVIFDGVPTEQITGE